MKRFSTDGFIFKVKFSKSKIKLTENFKTYYVFLLEHTINWERNMKRYVVLQARNPLWCLKNIIIKCVPTADCQQPHLYQLTG